MCNAYFWLQLWIKWLEVVHLGHLMEPMDSVLPAIMTASGKLQPCSQLMHDTIQKWLNESAEAVGISDRLTTHCFRHGGVQYQLLSAPLGQQWALHVVQWWVNWAEGEQVSTWLSHHFVSSYLSWCSPNTPLFFFPLLHILLHPPPTEQDDHVLCPQ